MANALCKRKRNTVICATARKGTRNLNQLSTTNNADGGPSLARASPVSGSICGTSGFTVSVEHTNTIAAAATNVHSRTCTA